MNISGILKAVQRDRLWMSGDQDTPELGPCPFCGAAGAARVVVKHPMYGESGALVRCRSCGACGPIASVYTIITNGGWLKTPLLPESLEHGIAAAVDTWNSGVVDRSRLHNLRMEEVKT